ncbi:hypothetical protein BH09ACT4_BH09ACT4_25750 [soil metagenome]
MRYALLGVAAAAALIGGIAIAPTVLSGAGAADAADLAGASLSASTATTATTYKNCTALNKKYPHGVGKPGAHDKVSGSTKPVTNFKVSASLYSANKKSDRDHDGVACEKR